MGGKSAPAIWEMGKAKFWEVPKKAEAKNQNKGIIKKGSRSGLSLPRGVPGEIGGRFCFILAPPFPGAPGLGQGGPHLGMGAPFYHRSAGEIFSLGSPPPGAACRAVFPGGPQLKNVLVPSPGKLGQRSWKT